MADPDAMRGNDLHVKASLSLDVEGYHQKSFCYLLRWKNSPTGIDDRAHRIFPSFFI